ncbi:tubulin binding cofactor [Oesophagostomum dentatum]|uniref:Tubulin binding cofactor n=1 Tax=Oesophagostomum dentatum TaxID=61180 RepID=A0A0B1S162_OESDE|nr:tubulin binding cofactor [Oesophagostomum dentatum]
MDKYRIHDLDDVIEVRRGVAGQPMAIESCKNSSLLVLDHTSTITVDDCIDCLIMLAPCSGSVFLRDCQSCTVLTACQQLRTRDCRNIRIALHCATQPIIEETTNVVFHPLLLRYDSFINDMVSARLSLFSSYSHSVHDFTPEKGSLHYRISDDPLLLDPDHASTLKANGVTTDIPDSAIPFKEQRTGPKWTHFY